MSRNTVLICLVCFLAVAAGGSVAQSPASTPSFTISATNITMPSNGAGSIPIILTSVNGFAGTVVVGCTAPNPPAGVSVPYCDLPGPVASTYELAANAKMSERIGISASAPLPPSTRLNLPIAGEGASLALAGVLMLGFGFRRRRARWPALLLAIIALIGSTGIVACGSSKTLTPGTYTYTLKAYDQNDASITASTTVKVTVPPGIAVQ